MEATQCKYTDNQKKNVIASSCSTVLQIGLRNCGFSPDCDSLQPASEFEKNTKLFFFSFFISKFLHTCNSINGDVCFQCFKKTVCLPNFVLEATFHLYFQRRTLRLPLGERHERVFFHFFQKHRRLFYFITCGIAQLLRF